MAATAVEGDSAFVVMDPVLLALARYEKATTGRDYTTLLPAPVRLRQRQGELLEELRSQPLLGEQQQLAARGQGYRKQSN